MLKSWWVLTFCLISCLAYFHFMKVKRRDVSSLMTRLSNMEEAKLFCMQKNEDLHLRLASQSDPAWIEMILMRDLGVVPEGFLKVHFKR